MPVRPGGGTSSVSGMPHQALAGPSVSGLVNQSPIGSLLPSTHMWQHAALARSQVPQVWVSGHDARPSLAGTPVRMVGRCDDERRPSDRQQPGQQPRRRACRTSRVSSRVTTDLRKLGEAGRGATRKLRTTPSDVGEQRKSNERGWRRGRPCRRCRLKPTRWAPTLANSRSGSEMTRWAVQIGEDGMGEEQQTGRRKSSVDSFRGDRVVIQSEVRRLSPAYRQRVTRTKLCASPTEWDNRSLAYS